MSLKLLEEICKVEIDTILKIPEKEFSKFIKIGAGGDKTKFIDLVAEEATISYLEKIGYEGRIISEEIGEKRFGNKDYPIIILDPIDGTTNAIRGMIPYSISVAISNGPMLSDIYAGVVLEIPSNRIFKAEKNKGAYLNEKRIHVSNITSLRNAIIGIDMKARGKNYCIKEVLPLIFSVKQIRILGSAALELCYVASGALDLYIDNRELLRITDIAAPYIIIKEAGGKILKIDGSELDCSIDLKERISLIAGNNEVCKEVLSKIRRNF
ncbi:MAG: D-fructose 1,6-bisphosphatase [Candidatus Methanomethylicota archaeon]|jgi:myo-inositol-1(or 4)-monophosphatase|uniref:D-fructose 1,6-bisphosphatase n=1 Tax=Thermoproteota archaeon TaxID=2056631 RepID=A0A520KGQ1_9CREN|nr:D-fructose 1,6-bisphosphatase [Candidatus Methanomethylicia archaeon]NHV45716.1 D-fructose 1,6-bisphosphatase [Candidatus Verstraetearchaeota archaeon]RZN57325.1 MAG: D-fructose 1,6-bisphosphatase [Candidatus Verstraetearchaeota archaeon]TDA38064.1 MAG: D-fructose 1,6-bisphosphatase [Candidatus Verstraetearchaeota archaeon]